MDETVRLGDLISVRHGYAFPGTGFSDDVEYPTLVTPGNFSIGGGFKPSKPKTFVGSYPKEFELCAGDLVVSMTDLGRDGATLGLPATIPADGRFLHNQRIGRVEIRNDSRLDARFLNYFLRTADYRSHILGTATGSTVRHTSPSRIEDFPANIPAIAVQRSIGEVLGALDDKIAANDRIRRTADTFLAAVFERITAESSWTELTEIGTVNRAATNPVPGAELRYLDISSVGCGTYEFPEPISWDDAPGRARRVLSSGDTVWSTVRPNRRSHALVLDEDPLLVASTGLAVLTPKPNRIAGLFEATRTAEFASYLESVAEGSAYPAVRGDRFERAPVPALSADEWDAFESVASPLRRRAHAAAVESRYLASTRDELLPLLMSGKVRVKDAEAVASEAL